MPDYQLADIFAQTPEAIVPNTTIAEFPVNTEMTPKIRTRG
ncbi:hypothetical protein ACQ4M3_35035 [Leptolyngbya sp. AN03gr2]